MVLILFVPSQVVRIPHFPVLKRPIEPATIIRRERLSRSQPLNQIRIADEVSPKEQGVVSAGLDHAPAVRIVPAASGKERRRAEYAAEVAQVDAEKVPGFEEFVLFGETDELLVALYGVRGNVRQ